MHIDSNPEPCCCEMTVRTTEPASKVLLLPLRLTHSQVHSESPKYQMGMSKKTTMWVCQHKAQPCATMKLEIWVFMPN